MMHNLLSLSTYQNMDENFKESAINGKQLLDDLYYSCTSFRSKFYANGYEFIFLVKASLISKSVDRYKLFLKDANAISNIDGRIHKLQILTEEMLPYKL